MSSTSTRRWYWGHCATRLDAALQRWVQGAGEMAYIFLQWAAEPSALARDGYHPGAAQYRQWAEQVAQCAARLLRPALTAGGVQTPHPLR